MYPSKVVEAVDDVTMGIISSVIPNHVISGEVPKYIAYLMQYNRVAALADYGVVAVEDNDHAGYGMVAVDDTCHADYCDACFKSKENSETYIEITPPDIQDFLLDTESVEEKIAEALKDLVSIITEEYSSSEANILLNLITIKPVLRFMPFERVCPKCLLKLCRLYLEQREKGGYAKFIREHGQLEWYKLVAERIDKE